MIYDDILTGNDAKEWLKNNNIQSPDINKKTPYRLNNYTVIYFDNQNIMRNFMQETKVNTSSRRSNGDTEEWNGFSTKI